MFYWDGMHWVHSGGDGGAGAGRVTVSSVAPQFPLQGDVWFDSVSTQTFVWYDDGTSAQWVVAVNADGTRGPGGGLLDAPLTGGPYARQSGSWITVIAPPIDAGTY